MSAQSGPFNVYGALDHIQVQVASPVSAGTAFSTWALAYDSAGNFLQTFNGPASFSDLTGNLTGAPTSFTNGMALSRSASIADPFHGDRIKAVSGAVSGKSPFFNVFGTLDHIQVQVGTPVSAGSAFTTRALAYDSAGNFLRIFSGPASFSDLSGELSGAPSLFANGTAVSNSALIAHPFHADHIRVTSGAVSGQSGSFNVYGTLNHIQVLVGSPVSAGSAFTTWALAYDRAGNFLRIFNGPASFSDLSGELTGAPSSFTNGMALSRTASIADPFHLDRITVKSGAVSAQSSTFNVFGPLDHFDVSGPSGPILTSDTFTVTATARDSAGNRLNYFASATWSDSSGTLSPATPSDFVSGVSTTTGANVSAATSGDQITIVSGGAQGTSAAFDVNAPNAAPTDISLDNSSIAENQPSGTVVGNLSSTDADSGETFTYSLVDTGACAGPDDSSFQISGSQLESNATFDYETKNSYTVCIRTTDSGSPAKSFDKQFTINVTNVNEPPTGITLDNTSIDENKASGSVVGNLAQTGDPDSGESYSFSAVTSGCGGSFPDSSSFQTSGSQLQSAASFDYETKNSYTICVRVNDPGSPAQSFDKQFTITINDVNDPPVANADTYSDPVGNTLAALGTSPSGPNVPLTAANAQTGSTLISNDTDQDNPSGTFAHALSAVPETVTSADGGTATINSDGSFTYLPKAGDKNTTDSFTYHVTDGTATTAGTATIQIANTLVWYVNNALGSNGDGRSNSPFNSLGGVNGAGGSGDADGAGDILFLYQGSGNYTGGLPLETNQQLIGQPQGLTVSGNAIVAAGGSNPTITNSSGNGVTLADGNTIQRVDISSSGGAAVAGSTINTLTIGSNLTLSTSGSGTNGLDLNGGNGTINVGSTIQNTVGKQVQIQNRTGGTTTLTGTIGGTGTGINLNSNSGATINLTGPITLSTGANTAFNATGGGTITATGSGSTLTTSTGTALDVENTTIGSSNLTFQSITANGGSHGIVLISTGSSGHLAVTGTGTAGTGGSITGITGADLATNNCGDLGTTAPVGVGVYLKSTTAPSFAYMTFPGTFGNFGILGYSVNGFTLDHTTMTGTYGDNVNVDDDTVHFCTLTGSASITNDTISNGAETNLRVVNASGTLNRLTMTNDTFGLNQNGGGDGTLIEADGGTLNVTVEDSTFQGSRGTPFDALSQTGASMDLVFGAPGHGNTIHNTHSNIVPFAQDLAVTPAGTETFDINSNHFDSTSAVQAQGGVIINAALGTANASGYFRNNTIGTSGVANSGSSGNDPALDVESNGGGDLTIDVDNNQMYQWGSNGAGFLLQAGATSGNPTTVNATVTGNTIAQPGTFAVANNAQGFQLNNGTSTGENFTTCLKFSGNVLNGSGTGAGGDSRFRQRFNTQVDMPGYTGGSDGGTSFADMRGYIQGLNPTGPPTVTGISSTSGGGGFFNTSGGAACPLPSF